MTNQPETTKEIPSQEHLGYWVGSLASAIAKGADAELAPMGVTPCQWAILEAAFYGNANTLTGLARIIPVDAASISRQLDKLQKSGLVRRRRLRSDRRTVRIELTEAGRELVPKLSPRIQANNDRFLSGITSSEQAAFTGIIQKMLNNVSPTAAAASHN
ncbi:MAG: MarR family transcriptional regulator [Dehalococcoidia bacterium]